MQAGNDCGTNSLAQCLQNCHCEGALRPWQSREGTCSLYKLLLKRCAPIASVAALSERHAGQQHVAHGFCGVTPPELSLRGRFAPVAISQYLAGLWESCRRNRNCLHEIATSASGLLAMTNLWPSLFYRQPVRIGSNAPGPAVRSPACQKSPFGPFSPSCFQNCKISFCIFILQFCRCGGLLNAKGHPDGFLSHFSSLRNFRLGRLFDSLGRGMPRPCNGQQKPAAAGCGFRARSCG